MPIVKDTMPREDFVKIKEELSDIITKFIHRHKLTGNVFTDYNKQEIVVRIASEAFRA